MTLVLVAVIVVCFSLGDLSLTRGMKDVGEITSVRASALGATLRRAVRSPFLWCGGALQVAAFIGYIVALSQHHLSYVFPLTAASDIVTTAAARYVLRERVSPGRWAGVVVVSAGIALISIS